MAIYISDQQLKKVDSPTFDQLTTLGKVGLNGILPNAHGYGAEIGGGIYTTGNFSFDANNRSIIMGDSLHALLVSSCIDNDATHGSFIQLYSLGSAGNEGRIILTAGTDVLRGEILFKTGAGLTRLTIDKDGLLTVAQNLGVTGNTILTGTLSVLSTIISDFSLSGTARLLLINGSEGTPSLSFASDLNSGMFKIGADNIGISTNGTKRLDIADSKIYSSVEFESINFKAANKLTACATNAGEIDYGSASKKLTINENSTIDQNLVKTGTPTYGVPIGTVVAWGLGYYADGSNGSYTPLGGSVDVAGAKSWIAANAPSWWICDGTAPNDAGSPYWDQASKHVHNLTDSRFLMGYTSVGSIGGNNSSAHTHGTDSQLGTYIANHSHTVNGHTHYVGKCNKVSTAVYCEFFKSTFDGSDYIGVGVGSTNNTAGSGTTYKPANEYQSGTVNNGDNFISSSTSPGTSTSLGNIEMAHSHTTNSQSVTENRPVYLSTFYIIRIK